MVDSFHENTRFLGHSIYSSGSCGNSHVLGVSAVWSTEPWNLVNMREHLNGSDHLCIFVSFFFDQSVFGTIQRRLACPYAKVDTHQSRRVVKFCVAQFLRCCVSFSSFLSREGILHCCSSYGHVSLIVDQLDWQCCRSPLLHRCGVGLGMTGESVRNLKIFIEHIFI